MQHTHKMEYYSAKAFLKQLFFLVESKKYNKLMNITKKKQTHRYRELVVRFSSYQWGEGRGEGQHKE